MNTLTPINNDDVYEEVRASNQFDPMNIPDFPEEELEAPMPPMMPQAPQENNYQVVENPEGAADFTPPAEGQLPEAADPMAIPDFTEAEMQAPPQQQQPMPQPMPEPIPVAQQLSAEGELLKKRDNEKKAGLVDIATFVMSPLAAFGDAAIAPIAEGAESVGEAFQISARAFLDRLLPGSQGTAVGGLTEKVVPRPEGQDSQNNDYAGRIVEQHFPNIPDILKPTLAMGLGVVSDPTTFLGLGSMKTLQAGMAAKHMQNIGEEVVTNKGFWEEGVEKILKVTDEIDEAELTEIGQVAAKADRGDKEALKRLAEILADKRVTSEANRLEREANELMLKDWDTKVGFSDKQKIVEFNDKVMRQARKDGIMDPDYITEGAMLNIPKIRGEKDLDIFIKEIHDQFQPSLAAAKGTRTLKDIDAGAANIALSDMIGRTTIPLSAEHARAMQIGFSVTANTAKKLMAVAAKTGDPMDIAAARQAFDVNVMMMHKATGVRSEAGRTLRVLQETAAPSAARVKELQAYMKDAATDDDFLWMMRNAKAHELSTKEFLHLAEKGQRSFARRGYDAFYETYVNAILSGPLTHSVNIVSNTSMLAIRPSEKYLESLSAWARRDTLAASQNLKEANAMVAGMVGGISDVFRLASRRANKAQVGYPEELEKMHELSRQSVRPAVSSENLGATGALGKLTDAIGSIIRLPGNALLKEDKAFKLINYRMSVNQEAVKTAMETGASHSDSIALYRAIKNNPDENIVKQAIDTADLFTFTNKLEGHLANWEEALRTPGINLLVPFFRTPTNILKYGARNSIAGNIVKDLPKIFAKGAKGDVHRAKFAIGTLAPVSIAMALGDNLTGGFETETGKGRLKAEFDAPPYSIRVGDQWVSYARLEPIRSILGLVSTYSEAMNHIDFEDEDLMTEIGTAVVHPFLRVMSDNSYIDTLGHLHYLIDGAMSGNLEAFNKQFSKMFAAMAAPNFIAQMTNLEMDTKFRVAEGFVENFKKRIWGLSKDMPIRPNAFGEAQYYPRGMIAALVNPFLQRPDRKDAIADKMIELEVDIPNITPKDFSLQSIPLKLTTEQRSRFGVLLGKGTDEDVEADVGAMPPVRQQLKEIFANPIFKEAPAENQKKIVESVYARRRAQVKDILFKTEPSLREQFNDAKLAKQELAEKAAQGGMQ